MNRSFVHLRNHTTFAIKDGTQKVKSLISMAEKFGMPAVAITDPNMFASIKFLNYSKGSVVKPIFGAEIDIEADNVFEHGSTLLLYAKNNNGYRELMEIVSSGYLKDSYEKNAPAYVDRELIESLAKNNNLIALSGGIDGDIGKSIILNNGKEFLLAERWKTVFGDNFFVEISKTGKKRDDIYLQRAVDLALDFDIPIVATNNNVFEKKEDFDIHETRVCIIAKETRAARGYNTTYSPHQYFKNSDEMIELFSEIPEAIENSVRIANACNVNIETGKSYLPTFPTQDGMTEADFLKNMAKNGLKELMPRILRQYDKKEHELIEEKYNERLDLELDVISKMGFPGYFLIVADFIQWSKNNSIPVGPGRGSGAGSLVAYACKITNLDPLPYDLLFERFLNPERVSMPDFDIDFCMDKRDLVIKYMADKYGQGSVAQIATFGTMAAKASVKDVSRVLGFPFSVGEKISKLIPTRPGITLEIAITESPPLQDLIESDSDVSNIIKVAKFLEGTHRSVGKHAGGVVVSPTKITDFSPIYRDSNKSSITSQYYKDDVESVGLVKFDFLGLRTLTVIDWAIQSINNKKVELGEDLFHIEDIPIYDKETYEKIFDKCCTTAVFQLESGGMKGLVKKLKPDCFEDLIALVALFRPGPLQSGMVDSFINRKHGIESIEYPHESIAPVLAPTYGVIVYQEQVMQIAQVMAGYTLGGADILRRAMGKKKPEEMTKQRSVFVNGCIENGISEKLGADVFDLMEFFSGYGFNKSHSAAYALISYQTAYLKAHFPSHFMAASLTSEMNNLDKIALFVADCKSIGVNVLPLNINESEREFVAKDDSNILFGFGAAKGIGDAAIEVILNERKINGEYLSFFDFIRRTSSKVNKSTLSSLVKSGSLDCFDLERSVMFELIESSLEYRKQIKEVTDLFKKGVSVDDIINKKKKSASKKRKSFNENQLSLFALDSEEPENNVSDLSSLINSIPEPKINETVRPWNLKTRLSYESETLGVYMSGHPLDDYITEIANTATCKIRDISLDEHGYNSETKKTVLLVGAVTNLVVKSRGSKKNAFFNLDDGTGVIKIAMFGKHYTSNEQKIKNGSVLVIDGKILEDKKNKNAESEERDEVSLKLSPTVIQGMSELREKFAKNFIIEIEQSDLSIDRVRQALSSTKPFSPGFCNVYIIAKGNSDDSFSVNYGTKLTVIPADTLIEDLKLKGIRSFVLHEKSKIPYKVVQKDDFVFESDGKKTTLSESSSEIRDMVIDRLRIHKSLFNEFAELKGITGPILSRKLKTRDDPSPK